MTASTRLAITLIGVVLLGVSHLRVLDNHGLEVTEAGLSRALVTFAVSRGLNGVISVVQGTEVAVEPVGIGMTFTPGQILDPVNDLIERFSTIVLVAGTAFGLQRVALEVTSADLYLWFSTAVVVLGLLMLWWRRAVPEWVRITIYKSALVLMIVRFAVPVMAIGGESFYAAFLAPQFIESSAHLQQTSEQLGQLQAESQTVESASEKPSLFDSARRWMASASSSLDVKQHIADFKAAAEEISEHAIRLMVVFVFQTIVVPLLSLWLVLKLLKSVTLFRYQA